MKKSQQTPKKVVNAQFSDLLGGFYWRFSITFNGGRQSNFENMISKPILIHQIIPQNTWRLHVWRGLPELSTFIYIGNERDQRGILTLPTINSYKFEKETVARAIVVEAIITILDLRCKMLESNGCSPIMIPNYTKSQLLRLGLRLGIHLWPGIGKRWDHKGGSSTVDYRDLMPTRQNNPQSLEKFEEIMFFMSSGIHRISPVWWFL